MAREDLLARTFVALADAWVDDFDLVGVSELVAQRCSELFASSAAGILLSDGQGHLRVSASSSDQVHGAQLFELRVGEGPCVDCYRTGQPVMSPGLTSQVGQWPRFVPVALAAGFRSVHAVPVRAREHILGSLSLFGTRAGAFNEADALAAQSLALATAFAILRHRSRAEAELRAAGPPRPGLADRLLLEQAKGMLAGRAGISIDEAHGRIERYARHHRLEVAAVSREVVAGTLNLVTFLESSALRHRNQW